MSAGPPAAKGTTIFTGRAGHDCADAIEAAAERISAERRMAARRISLVSERVVAKPHSARSGLQHPRSARTAIPARLRLRRLAPQRKLGNTCIARQTNPI